MSELLSSAASALGIPEALVQRSAEARATETGQSVDEILAAWAGGEAVEAAAPAAEAPAAEEAEPGEAAAPAEPEPTPEVETPPAPVIETPVVTPAPTAPAAPYKPPILVNAPDTTMPILTGAIGLFLLVLLVGLVGPSIQGDEPGARSSEIPFSQAALDGQDVYTGLGCNTCHTQMVRPVVADVGLGAVTLSDTNQVLGVRRFGPDLSNVGSRMSAGGLQAIVSGDTPGHPDFKLSGDDLEDLIAYLSESRTAEG